MKDFKLEAEHIAKGGPSAPTKPKKLPKVVDVASLEALKPPDTAFFDSATEKRLRVFWAPGRRSTGMVYKGKDINDAAQYCLRWAWQRHLEKPGSTCPWLLTIDEG